MLTPRISLAQIRESPRRTHPYHVHISTVNWGIHSCVHSVLSFIAQTLLSYSSILPGNVLGIHRSKPTLVPALLELTVRSCCVVCIKHAAGKLWRSGPRQVSQGWHPLLGVAASPSFWHHSKVISGLQTDLVK